MSIDLRASTDSVDRAIKAFSIGRPVLIYDADDRENETDLVYPARAVRPKDVARLRNDAGGLICVALAHEAAEVFDLPFLQDALDHPAVGAHDLDYDERSSFSLTVNHRDNYTGITDVDRARTISALGMAARCPEDTDFAAEFNVPGHVHLLKAAPNLLEDRLGHTELGIALAAAANREPAVVVCEMLNDSTHHAASLDDARRYAEEHGLVFVEGKQLVQRLQATGSVSWTERTAATSWVGHNR